MCTQNANNKELVTNNITGITLYQFKHHCLFFIKKKNFIKVY